MKTLLWAALLLSLVSACESLRSRSPHLNVPLLIRRAAGIVVPDAPGIETTHFSRPGLRPELRRICMLWPLSTNRINSSYGRRFNREHEGLDLRAPQGTPVHAVLPGVVIYAGDGVRGYGLLVLVKHPRGLTTAYAHNSKIVVEPGQRVRAGQVIALSGNTGHTSGPHLHFEVRDGTQALDPLKFLPAALDLRGIGRGIGRSRREPEPCS